MSGDTYDLFVIGGGVNGCGIARDAAGRDYSVYLAEMDDLASGTSSASTKLVHGGLRYLEHFEFRLVREALAERGVLWGIAPHLIWPMRFILPHMRGLRPAWMLRAGLLIYDNLGGRNVLPPTRTLDLRRHPAGRPLRGKFRIAFEYSDCWVDDARLVVLNARDAAERGASINPRTKVLAAHQDGDGWIVEVQRESQAPERVRARMLVNAAGPWVDKVLGTIGDRTDPHNVRLVKGSHIVVRRIFEHDKCYIFQNPDGRIIFAIPYEHDFTLIGTTDLDYDGDPSDVAIQSDEISYLCSAASEYFAEPVTREQVVWAYSGVRPLYDDGASAAQEATRDYVLKLDNPAGGPPLLNVFGGKLTTYRHLAETALGHVDAALGRRTETWTAEAPLPGGEFERDDFENEAVRLRRDYPFIAPAYARRLMRSYGMRARRVLGTAQSLAELGENFGADLTAREVEYLITEEWARTAEDILWRRSKLGLHISERDRRSLVAYLQAREDDHELAYSGD